MIYPACCNNNQVPKAFFEEFLKELNGMPIAQLSSCAAAPGIAGANRGMSLRKVPWLAFVFSIFYYIFGNSKKNEGQPEPKSSEAMQ